MKFSTNSKVITKLGFGSWLWFIAAYFLSFALGIVEFYDFFNTYVATPWFILNLFLILAERISLNYDKASKNLQTLHLRIKTSPPYERSWL